MANVITVTALNKYVRTLLESDAVLTDIAVRGEISNYKRHDKTGHCYFSIKDEKSSVPAVMWRSDAGRLAFAPENGMGVIARCRVSLYERDGKFQLYVEDLFPDGVGAAQMAFEQLKARLAAEGLFAPEAKKPLPVYPKKVGLITSKTGAALQDIVKVASRRQPDAHFLLAPVTVQGEGAAPEIAAAITAMDKQGCDVLIVARGGGSAEDLWVFNAEAVARAAFACNTPLVSAIGHEIDFTILDFVADLRAPTPSAAAEQVIPDMQQAKVKMMYVYTKILDNIHAKVDSCYNRISGAAAHPALIGVGTLPSRLAAETATIAAQLYDTEARITKAAEARLAANAALAHSLNPYGVLARGYAVAQKDGKALGSVSALEVGNDITLTLADGSAGCRVLDIHAGGDVQWLAKA